MRANYFLQPSSQDFGYDFVYTSEHTNWSEVFEFFLAIDF